MGQAFCISSVPEKENISSVENPPQIIADRYSIDHVNQMQSAQQLAQEQNSKLKLFQGENDNTVQKISINDFEIIKNLGKGSFGKVMLVRYKMNKKLYAMKVLLKKKIQNERQKTHTKTERHILEIMDFPFIVKLHFAFQTREKLYLVCDFMSGGELFYHLKSKKEKRFSEEETKYYSAEVLLALEHLHKHNIIYRDLKPENILYDEFGHIKLTDFGLSKQTLNLSQHAHSLCGTPEYLAPEILLSGNLGHDKTCDWWSFGALIYEMLCGAPPHFMENKKEMFKKNCKEPIPYPRYLSKTTIDLLKKLLVVNPKKRLGYGEEDAKLIKQHSFYKDIDFEKLNKKELPPLIQIKVENTNQLKYFDQTIVRQNPRDTPVDTKIQIPKSIEVFPNFTYQRLSPHMQQECNNKNEQTLDNLQDSSSLSIEMQIDGSLPNSSKLPNKSSLEDNTYKREQEAMKFKKLKHKNVQNNQQKNIVKNEVQINGVQRQNGQTNQIIGDTLNPQKYIEQDIMESANSLNFKNENNYMNGIEQVHIINDQHNYIDMEKQQNDNTSQIKESKNNFCISDQEKITQKIYEINIDQQQSCPGEQLQHKEMSDHIIEDQRISSSEDENLQNPRKISEIQGQYPLDVQLIKDI